MATLSENNNPYNQDEDIEKYRDTMDGNQDQRIFDKVKAIESKFDEILVSMCAMSERHDERLDMIFGKT
jgi:hypothetical protein